MPSLKNNKILLIIVGLILMVIVSLVLILHKNSEDVSDPTPDNSLNINKEITLLENEKNSWELLRL